MYAWVVVVLLRLRGGAIVRCDLWDITSMMKPANAMNSALVSATACCCALDSPVSPRSMIGTPRVCAVPFNPSSCLEIQMTFESTMGSSNAEISTGILCRFTRSSFVDNACSFAAHADADLNIEFDRVWKFVTTNGNMNGSFLLSAVFWGRFANISNHSNQFGMTV